jgi:hypothetical protein
MTAELLVVDIGSIILCRLIKIEQRSARRRYRINNFVLYSQMDEHDTIRQVLGHCFVVKEDKPKSGRLTMYDDPPTEITHTAITGGTYNFKLYNGFDRFYTVFAGLMNDNCIEHQLVEVRTDIFPFFVDLDFELAPDVEFSCEEKDNLIKILICQMAKFFPSSEHDRLLKCIVLMSEPRDTWKKEVQLTKHGMHLHFPNCIVNLQMAMYIRASAIAGFEMLSQMAVEWCKVFDPQPYNHGGSLRMVGMSKNKVCNICFRTEVKKRRHGEKPCGGQCGERCPKSVYKLHTVFCSMPPRIDTTTKMILGNKMQLLKQTTVRSTLETPEATFAPYNGCPQAGDYSFKVNKPGGIPQGIVDPESSRSVVGKGYTMINDERLIALVGEYMGKYQQYKNSRISSLKRANSGAHYIASISGEGRNSCYVSNRVYHDHRSNRVYIRIDRASGNTAEVAFRCSDEDCKKKEWHKIRYDHVTQWPRVFFPESDTKKRKANSVAPFTLKTKRM